MDPPLIMAESMKFKEKINFAFFINNSKGQWLWVHLKWEILEIKMEQTENNKFCNVISDVELPNFVWNPFWYYSSSPSHPPANVPLPLLISDTTSADQYHRSLHSHLQIDDGPPELNASSGCQWPSDLPGLESFKSINVPVFVVLINCSLLDRGFRQQNGSTELTWHYLQLRSLATFIYFG